MVSTSACFCVVKKMFLYVDLLVLLALPMSNCCLDISNRQDSRRTLRALGQHRTYSIWHPHLCIKYYRIINHTEKGSENLNSIPGSTFGLLCEFNLETI